MALESRFQSTFIKTLRTEYPEAILLKNDANYLQGVPDLLFLYYDFWATFEIKRDELSPRRPNQEYYVDLMNGMSFSAFVYPQNVEDVLRELQRALRSRRPARVPKR